MLRSYINFAMNGYLPENRKKENILYDIDKFSEQVGKFLTQNGYKIKMNIGCSDYTIDIGVEHPNNPGHFIAGIECDGNSYYMARTVKDRDHLRTAILKSMGWKMYRVWSTEWIHNNSAEKERLINFIKDAINCYDKDKDNNNKDKISLKKVDYVITEKVKKVNTSINSKNPYKLEKYVEGKWKTSKSYKGSNDISKMAEAIRAIVKVEQPMHMDLMYKKVGSYFVNEKVTQPVKNNIDRAINEYMKGEVIIKDEFIKFVNFKNITARMSELGSPDRIIEYISIPEIAVAMEKILIGKFGMDINTLCTETGRVFGFERIGPKIKQRTNEAVEYLVNNKKISLYDGKVQLLE